ncbi:hypothetical protein KQH27_00365 [bacterium]|nr:hypothetical protein [bacterium]
MMPKSIKKKAINICEILNKKLDRVYKRIYKNERESCKSCGRRFTWHTWGNKCEYCNDSFCSKCISCFSEELNEDFNVKICGQCWYTYTTGINSIILVKSPNIGRHKIIKNIDKIYTSEWNDICDVESELKHLGFIQGANAVLEYRYKKIKNSKENENGNTYYYNTFRGSGRAVVIAPFV